MSASGPELPPHLLAKRKRAQEESAQDEASRPSGAKRAKTPESEQKRKRVVGPAPPPAPLDERPSVPTRNDGDSSSDEDDFGPALPSIGDAEKPQSKTHEGPSGRIDEEAQASAISRRDEWMMLPPKQDDLAARMDPTKIRARGFNTGKSAKGPAGTGGDNAMWTETPEQKAKRLQDEMMGIKAGPSAPIEMDKKSRQKRAEDEATAARLNQNRGKSLYEHHQKSYNKDEEDDPAKRGFDREKDMAAGGKISAGQRKEMLNQASGFSSKFAGGSYL